MTGACGALWFDNCNSWPTRVTLSGGATCTGTDAWALARLEPREGSKQKRASPGCALPGPWSDISVVTQAPWVLSQGPHRKVRDEGSFHLA